MEVSHDFGLVDGSPHDAEQIEWESQTKCDQGDEKPQNDVTDLLPGGQITFQMANPLATVVINIYAIDEQLRRSIGPKKQNGLICSIRSK